MLDGVGNHDRWIWAFERERQGLLRDYRLLSQSVLWLASHPKLGAKVLSLLRLSPALFSHFIGVAGGVSQLFSVNGCDVAPSRVVESMRSETSLPQDLSKDLLAQDSSDRCNPVVDLASG